MLGGDEESVAEGDGDDLGLGVRTVALPGFTGRGGLVK